MTSTRSSWRRVAGLLVVAVLLLVGARAVTWASPQFDEGSPAAAPRHAAGEAGSSRHAGAAADPVVAAAGDIAPDQAGGHDQKTSDQVLATNPDAVLALGDEQYPDGALEDFRRYYDATWGRFKDKTRPTPGNHEYEGGAAGYFDYFGAAARPNGTSYYSFDLGGWHLVSLDANVDHGAGSPQEQWLRADLAATGKRCVLAYWHQPRFTSGVEHGDDESVGPFWNDLYEARADVVLNGHEHQYERFSRQNPDAAADPRGIREFVVGTGGRSLYPFGSADPNSELRDNSDYGVLELTLHPDGYDWRFVSENGAVVDAGGSVACH
ncbi:MAG TPA: metallophosphoesterase [Actinomycetes bacterium]